MATPKQKAYIEELLFDSSPEEVYQMVLDGTLSSFPKGFWSMPENYQYANSCLIYLIEEILNWTPEYCKDNLNISILRQYKLSTPLSALYSSSVSTWLMALYPQFKPWEFPRVTLNYWNKDTLVEAVRWLLLEKLQWTREEILENWEIRLLPEHKIVPFQTIYELGFDSNTLLITAIPDIQLHELRVIATKHYPTEYLLDNARKALDGYNRDEIINHFDHDFIMRYNLHKFYEGEKVRSLHKVLNLLYPNEYKEWEVTKMPPNFWTKEKCVEALQWLINEKLHWTPEDCYYKLTIEILKEYRISGVYKFCDYSIGKVLNLVYSDMFDYSVIESERQRYNYYLRIGN